MTLPHKCRGTRHARSEGRETLQEKELGRVLAERMSDFPQDVEKGVWNDPVANRVQTARRALTLRENLGHNQSVRYSG